MKSAGVAGGDGHDCLAILQIDEGLSRRGMSVKNHRGLAVGGAELIQVERVELRAGFSEQPIKRYGVLNLPDHVSILRRDIGDVIRRDHSAGPYHVFRRDARIAWLVLFHVLRDEPRISVITAANARGDDEIDGLAAPEGSGRLSVAGGGERREDEHA